MKATFKETELSSLSELQKFPRNRRTTRAGMWLREEWGSMGVCTVSAYTYFMLKQKGMAMGECASPAEQGYASLLDLEG